jgi:hypothetical protein
MPTADTTPAPAETTPTMDEEYPIHSVRFIRGRTYHRTKRPPNEEWWTLLYAACGKTGHLERGFPLGAITPCRGCHKAIYGTTPADTKKDSDA